MNVINVHGEKLKIHIQCLSNALFPEQSVGGCLTNYLHLVTRLKSLYGVHTDLHLLILCV